MTTEAKYEVKYRSLQMFVAYDIQVDKSLPYTLFFPYGAKSTTLNIEEKNKIAIYQRFNLGVRGVGRADLTTI